LNEAVTNAIKYAFTARGKGVILVTLLSAGDQELELCIADNGKGLPPDFDLYQSASLGFSLIRTLCDQLDGKLYVESNGGVSVRVVFPVPATAFK
jgi:two-component sensor histidine kinase